MSSNFRDIWSPCSSSVFSEFQLESEWMSFINMIFINFQKLTIWISTRCAIWMYRRSRIFGLRLFMRYFTLLSSSILKPNLKSFKWMLKFIEKNYLEDSFWKAGFLGKIFQVIRIRVRFFAEGLFHCSNLIVFKRSSENIFFKIF